MCRTVPPRPGSAGAPADVYPLLEGQGTSLAWRPAPLTIVGANLSYGADAGRALPAPPDGAKVCYSVRNLASIGP